MRALWVVVAVVVAACGNHGGTLDPDASGSGGSDAMPDASGDGWTDLIKREWTLSPPQESYFCRRIMVTQDTYISSFRALSPPGTHHELLTISPDLTQTGNFNCNGQAIASEPEMLFAGGEQTNEFNFPPGVAIKIPAGTYILLYLHVLNVSDATMTETSGVQVKTVAAADVVHEADMIFGGSMNFSIPQDNGATMHTVASDCGAPSDWHIVGMWPHMHRYGKHEAVVVKHQGVVTKTLVDVDYDVNNQRNYAMDVLVPTNDRIETTCTFLNNSATVDPPGYPLAYGDNANSEMCFSGMYKWPKQNNGLYTCVN